MFKSVPTPTARGDYKQCGTISASQWGAADAEIKYPPGLSRFPLSKLAVGQNTASHAVPAYRASTYIVYAFPAHSFIFYRCNEVCLLEGLVPFQRSFSSLNWLLAHGTPDVRSSDSKTA